MLDFKVIQGELRLMTIIKPLFELTVYDLDLVSWLEYRLKRTLSVLSSVKSLDLINFFCSRNEEVTFVEKLKEKNCG